MHIQTTLAGASLLACMLCAEAQPMQRTASLAAADASPILQLLSPAGEGRRKFLALNCYVCHGMFAGGAMAPAIAHAERGDVSEALLQGEDAGMPSFKAYVTSTDIDNITAYLASIGGPNEPVFMDWWVKTPPK